MSPQVTSQLAKLATASADRSAWLVFVDGNLAAIMVRLDDVAHEKDRGSWFLEVGFGACEVMPPLVFKSMDAAEAWVLARNTDVPVA